MVSRIASTVPEQPVSLVVRDSASLAEIGLWASQEQGSRLRVVVPDNLESFSDDPMVKLACAAIATYAEVECIPLTCGTHPVLDSRSQKNVCQWALGAAAFLRHKASSPPDSRGAWARGWHWAASWNMNQHKVDAWLLKGTPEHLTRALTGKAWSKSVPVEYGRIETLVRNASKRMEYLPDPSAWQVPYHSLVGTHIKKSFFSTKSGVLSDAEIVTLSSAFESDLEAYKGLEDRYTKISSMSELSQFPTVIASVTRRLSALEALYDSIVRARITFVTPESIRDKKREAKRPMKDRIAEIDPHKEYNLMCISVAYGWRYHPLRQLHDEPDETYQGRLRDDIVRWASRMTAPQELRTLAEQQMIANLEL